MVVARSTSRRASLRQPYQSMDIPFASSGALSRAHYAFVRKVEAAASSSAADQLLQEEAISVQFQLSQPGLTQRRCKESLILLMYCAMATTFGTIPTEVVELALPHAITLAESGMTVQDKRIGYLFCAELMPTTHELRLMLVNTIRKDLGSPNIPQICLALDALIGSPNELIIPAVQSRLHDLLSHSSAYVRGRALLAFKALSTTEATLLHQVSAKLFKRLKDSQPFVASAAVLTTLLLAKVDAESKERVASEVNALLQQVHLDKHGASPGQFLLILLRAVRSIGLTDQSVSIIINVLRAAAASRLRAVLYETFRVLRDCDSQALFPMLRSTRFSPVRHIRELLTSPDLNDQYTFLLCLECVDPELWAGTNANIAPILEGWEVERVMQLLYSQDPLIRRKTLGILNKVDPNIVINHYSQVLQSVSTTSPSTVHAEPTTRLLEIVEVQTASDGEAYAREVKELFRVLEGPPLSQSQTVSEPAVQIILMHVMTSSPDFALSCATALLTAITEVELHVGPTLIVLVSALAVEYAVKVSVSPLDIMRGLGSRLEHCSAAVQDACLLAMLRLSADCEEIPSDIISQVSETMYRSGRHIKRRCDQFLILSAQKIVVTEIIRSARSPSLPDFVIALQDYETRSSHPSTQTHSSRYHTPVSSPTKPESRKLPSPKLRYKAYEPPPSTPSLRRHLSTPCTSPHMIGREVERSPLRRPGLMEALANTVSPGGLALAAGIEELEMLPKNTADCDRSPIGEQVLEDISSRIDLIAFDTPSIPDDPPPNLDHNDIDFEGTWNSLSDAAGARGWCAMSMEGVMRILQQSLEGYRLKVIAVDYPPFLGELKILISKASMETEGSEHALLRLKDSEEESCLWRMRCADAGLRTRLKRLFADGEPSG